MPEEPSCNQNYFTSRKKDSYFIIHCISPSPDYICFPIFFAYSHIVFGVLETATIQTRIWVGPGGLWRGTAAASAETRIWSYVQTEEKESSD